MTFKGYKYGNGTTIDEYDPGKWQYGQTVCIIVVTIAVLAELLIFFAAIFLMIREIILMLIDSMTSPKTSSDVSADKLKKVFVSYKNGVFFKFTDKEAEVNPNRSQKDQSSLDKKKKKLQKGPEEPKKLILESSHSKNPQKNSKVKNQT